MCLIKIDVFNILTIVHILKHYNIFDVGLFMSRWETFGYCLVEGMKFKLPIISSQHIGNKDWIKKI